MALVSESPGKTSLRLKTGIIIVLRTRHLDSPLYEPGQMELHERPFWGSRIERFGLSKLCQSDLLSCLPKDLLW